MSRPTNSNTSARAENALSALAEGGPVQLDLAGGGAIRLGRYAPILCVYRRTPGRSSEFLERIARTEAVYAVIPAEPRRASRALPVLRTVVEHLARHYGTLLVLELWYALPAEHASAEPPLTDNGQTLEPRFEVIAPLHRIPRVTIEAMARSLAKDVHPFGGARVSLQPYRKVAPPGMKPLLRLSELKELNCYALGLAVRSADSATTTHEASATDFQALSHKVQCALDNAYFTFVQQRKSLRPVHYHAPSRDLAVKHVLEIDRQLSEIDRSFDLLLQATPINAESAWREFRRSQFEKAPTFFYRPAPGDPALIKRALYQIPIERIEDPTLAYLFRQKQEELDRQITLLVDVDSPRFLQESLQIYGGVSDWLLQHANELLDRVPTRSGRSSRGWLTSTEFAKCAQQELGYYQQRHADFSATVAVRDDMYAGMMVSGDTLLIGGKLRVARRRVEALLQHEIGTHLVTRYNGFLQPFRQLAVGLAGYDGLQEGLAVLAEYLVGGLSRHRMRVLAARVVAAHHLLDGASFVETFRMLHRRLAFSQRNAYTISMRIYRGGGLTKDAVYLRGLLQILRYLREDGQLEPLFMGKVASAHLPLIHELRARGILKPPAIMPRYVENAAAQRRIEQLRKGVKLLELVQ